MPGTQKNRLKLWHDINKWQTILTLILRPKFSTSPPAAKQHKSAISYLYPYPANSHKIVANHFQLYSLPNVSKVMYNFIFYFSQILAYFLLLNC